VSDSTPVTHDDLIAKNRRTSIMMLAVEFLMVGVLGAAIGALLTRSAATGIAIGIIVAIAVDAIAWLVAVRATVSLTHAVEVTPEQAPVLHNVVEGLCIRTGLPKPKVYIVDDPSPNAFAFGRSPKKSGVAVTSGLLNLMSRRELEGVLAHEMSHVQNRDVQVSTLAVTTVGVLVATAEISARGSFFSSWGDDDNNGGALVMLAIAVLAGFLAFGARLLSFGISRHREELADTSAVALVSPGGLRRALEKLEADHTVTHHLSRATAHLWIEQPLEMEAKNRKAKTNKLFDTHPPIGERIAILRKLEGLDPNERGPVDATITGVPVDLAKLQASSQRVSARGPGGAAAFASAASMAAPGATPTTAEADTSVAPGQDPAGHPPGWYHADAQTLRYWDGAGWTDWTAAWNGSRWVQQRPS
jgi:heat shock protein HtpX